MRAARARIWTAVLVVAVATAGCATQAPEPPNGIALDAAAAFERLPAQADAEALEAFGRSMDRQFVHHTRLAAGMDDALGERFADISELLDSSRERLITASTPDKALRPSTGIILASTTHPRPPEDAPLGVQAAQTSFLVAMQPSGLADEVLRAERDTGEEAPPSHSRAVGGDERVSLTLDRTQAVEGETLSVDVSLVIAYALPDPPGGSVTETYTGTINVPVCPDASGTVSASIELAVRSALKGEAGTRDGETTITGDVTATADDDASLVSADYRLRASSRATARPAEEQAEGVYGEVTVDFRTTIGSDGLTVADASSSTIHRSSRATDAAIAGLAEMAMLQGALVMSAALTEAEQLWRNGFCVEVRLLEPQGDQTGVEPGSEHPIVAQAHHRRESVDIDAPIEADLITGETSVSPDAERLPSPARFMYTAAPDQSNGGRVRLRSVSRRGIGETDVHFGTGGNTGYKVEATRTETWEALADTLITASGTATEVDPETGSLEGEGTFTESRYAGEFCPGRGDDPEAVKESSGVALFLVVVTPDGLIALATTPDGRSLIGYEEVAYVPIEGGTVTTTLEVSRDQAGLHCGGGGTIVNSITITPLGDEP